MGCEYIDRMQLGQDMVSGLVSMIMSLLAPLNMGHFLNQLSEYQFLKKQVYSAP
jgi:hypothetical protein